MIPVSPPRVVRNDWSGLAVPELGRWRPTRSVSVVIPAYRCQASLDLVLAALAHQTYPASLLEVVVVDDGSRPPLVLPDLRPEHCRLVKPPDGWGRANALAYGARHSEGEVLHWLDADMVAYPQHVEAQARWHEQVPYAVTLGYKRFVDVAPGDPHWPSALAVAGAGAEGDLDGLFGGVPSEPHSYVEDAIRRTGRLRGADHTAFLVHVGATAALRRELYDLAGGLDPRLRLGEDTEFGYRLAQAGAVFIPEPAARAWHLGRTHMMRHEQRLRRYNRPHLADRMPQPRWLRRAGGSGWSVPLVTVVVEVGDQPLEPVRAAVDSALASDERDLRVLLVGEWASLTDGRVSPLADPRLELRLIAATYRPDPRVDLVERSPETGFPSPFLLRLPPSHGLARPTLRRLVEYADREQVGLVRAGAVELWRTAAVHRARYQIPRCHQRLLEYYGQAGVWHPIGPLVRQALLDHHPEELSGIELSDEDWVNIIDVDAWRRKARPPKGPRPRIGRHSRDHPMKWPASREELRAAYPDSGEYEVRVLGGATAPESVLGALPDNWRVTQFGEIAPAEFLAGIDVFVYFPHPSWVESFGRVVLEAMAAGVPVVLPESFRPLFGAAATYARPSEVRQVVDRLWRDDDHYAERVDAAQRFVERRFGYRRHAERLERFVRTS